jgi:hypothetical protein
MTCDGNLPEAGGCPATIRSRPAKANAVLNRLPVAKPTSAAVRIAAAKQRDRKMQSTQFIVARDDFQQCKFIETPLPAAAELPEESLLIKVDRFAFTANNITYAMAGDQLKYWHLFPAPDGFGNIPVWGFGDVIASRHPNISEGTYDAVSSMAADRPAAFVDMAGNAKLRGDLHRHLSDRLVYSSRVGLTHRDTSRDDENLPGAKPIWFFAPDQIRKRAKEWGPGGLEQRFGAAWSGLVPMLDRWIKVTEGHGQAAVSQVYLDTLNGRVPPDQGHILSVWE